jgi:hypothetical protein
MLRPLRAAGAALVTAAGLAGAALAGTPAPAPPPAEAGASVALPAEAGASVALPANQDDALAAGDELGHNLLRYQRECLRDGRPLDTLVCDTLRKELRFGPPPTIEQGWK